MSDLWKFSSIPCIEESTFNKILERFYNFGISGLVRENIQNSLDGKIPGETKPVVVTIKTGTIKKENIPGLEEIKNRINCLEGRNSYTKETIQHMKNKMNDEIINYISFEDYNTKGLKGAKMVKVLIKKIHGVYMHTIKVYIQRKKMKQKRNKILLNYS